jgi:hypothetical protein
MAIHGRMEFWEKKNAQSQKSSRAYDQGVYKDVTRFSASHFVLRNVVQRSWG